MYGLLVSWLSLIFVTVRAQGGASVGTALAVHGGAGSIRSDAMSEARADAHRKALRAALGKGYEVLRTGGCALDAVQAAITVMEDENLFNAGRGAVLTSENTVELDAAIMDGKSRTAGALTGVKTVKHPIRLARTIMDESSHVMLAGDGAEAFARQHGLERVKNEYFILESRRSGPSPDAPSADGASGDAQECGTVGAVALDEEGCLAAGASTGGTAGKTPGRVGDSPLIGAGTYAANASCAVSATGQGEFFVRGVAAHGLASRMRWGDQSLAEAAQATIDEVEEMGGLGGVIALDRGGNIAMPFSTAGMFRAYVDPEGNTAVRLFGQNDDA